MHLCTAKHVFLWAIVTWQCCPGREGVWLQPWGTRGPCRQVKGRQACVWRKRSIPASGRSPGNNTTLWKGNQGRKLHFGQLTVTASPEWFCLKKGRCGWAEGAWGACPDLCYLWESRYQSQSLSCSHFQSTSIEQPLGHCTTNHREQALVADHLYSNWKNSKQESTVTKSSQTKISSCLFSYKTLASLHCFSFSWKQLFFRNSSLFPV